MSPLLSPPSPVICPPARDRYLELSEIDAWLQGLAADLPGWVRLDELGRSGEGRPIWMLTIGAAGPDLHHRPAFWVDAGTHCAEWAGVSAAVDAIARWVTGALDGSLAPWLRQHSICVIPVVSPDGYEAMMRGAAYIRSNLRPPPEGAHRSGWSPEDMDGDGVVRWMRWRHPAGPFVADPAVPLHLRARRLGDDPADAFFMAEEGRFLAWDGVRWSAAPREHGLDLNRNFPGAWAPASMFGMDAGAFPGSAPEARALLDALHARPQVAAAISLHTFTGALLVAPYRADGPLPDADLRLMRALADDAVLGTGYRVIQVHPDFTYDPKAPIRGVWADTLATVFGLPGYTLEVWDPFAPAGVRPAHAGRFFRDPEPDVLQAVVRHYQGCPGTMAWTPFDHPQLGPVEIGGLDLQRTLRNPPEADLAAELDRVFPILDRARRALPRLEVRARVVDRGAGRARIDVEVENMGFLPTPGLAHAAAIGRVPPVRVDVPGAERPVVELGDLDGWGSARVGPGSLPLMPQLPAGGHRAAARFDVEGEGPWTVSWHSARAGRGRLEVRRGG